MRKKTIFVNSAGTYERVKTKKKERKKKKAGRKIKRVLMSNKNDKIVTTKAIFRPGLLGKFEF